MIIGTSATAVKSECARLAYSLNWQQHAMGIPASWPQSLVSTLSIIFNSKFPMFLFWGPQFYCFYNDAYRPSMGNSGKHPGAMGQMGQAAWPEIWAIIHPELEQVMNGGESTWHEDAHIPIFRNNQMEDVYWTYSYSPVIGEWGKVAGVFVTVNETTKRVLAEKHLINLTNQLKVNAGALAKSNQALAQLAYIASHDLKEPLRMVTSFMELLKRKYAGQLDDKANTYIDFALDGGKRMMRMIDDLLEFSRINGDGRRREMVSLDDITKEAGKNISRLIKKNNATIKVTTPLPALFVFRSEITRLIQNLASNAIKFRKKEIDPLIQVNATEKDDEWLFSIEDNGIGIEQEKCEKIFEIFTRLHTQGTYDGTGIGLAVCKRVVEHHGGKIWVESEVGKGSIFYFTLLKQ